MARNRGRAKPKLRDLSRKILSEREVQELLAVLDCPRQPPVLTAVYGASIVEYELENLICPRIGRGDPNTWASLTDDRGPLNSFHTKIIMGYALRAFDDAVRENLDIVRTVRNAFAHTRAASLDFDHALITAELRKIVPIPRARKVIKELLQEAQREVEADPAVTYIHLCGALYGWMSLRQKRRLQQKNWRLEEKTARLEKALLEAKARLAGYNAPVRPQ